MIGTLGKWGSSGDIFGNQLPWRMYLHLGFLHEVCDEKWVMLEGKISGELGCKGLKYQRKEFKLLKWKCFMYCDDSTVDWEWAEVFFSLYSFQMSSECLIGQN